MRERAAREQPHQPDLIEQLPTLTLKLIDAPDALQRDLYAAFSIKVVYDHDTRHVSVHATLTTETLPGIAHATAALSAHNNGNTPPGPPPEPLAPHRATTQRHTTTRGMRDTATKGTTVAHVLGAPGRAHRTWERV
ncbi:hypothetical protein [Nocardia wallacei]|uniref:hypothetical protein n=1 Tax=Nocardia wallacei TaxID=480035 RepID=UPI002458F296|nr:hypothetical protein [Nocardia wallacei]